MASIRILFYLIIFTSLFIVPVQDTKPVHNRLALTATVNQVKIAEQDSSIKIIDQLAFRIINIPKLDPGEDTKISEITRKWAKNYLLALIKKRSGDFSEMYNLLIASLPELPAYYRYYNELVFSASARNKVDDLNNKLNKIRKASYYYYAKSIIYSTLNKYDDAIRNVNLALKLDSSNYYVLFQKAAILKNSGDYDLSMQLVEKQLSPFLNNAELAPEILNLKGTLYNLSNRNNEASEFYKKAAYAAWQSGSNKILSTIHTNRGIIFDESGEIDSARHYYNLAITGAKELSDYESEALAFSEQGVSYSYTNDLLKAKQLYLESYRLYSSLGNKLRLAFLSNNLGRVYAGYGNYKAALESFEKGIQMAGESKRALIQNLIGAADVYANLSNYSKALNCYAQADTLAGQIKEVKLQSEVNIGLGSLNFNLNQLHNAEYYFNKAEKQIEESGNEILSADILNKKGILLMQSGKLTNSEQYFHNAITKAKNVRDIYTEISASLNLSDLYLRKENYSEADKMLKISDGLINEYSVAEMSGEQQFLEGKLFSAQNNNSLALKYFKDAMNFAKSSQNYNLRIESSYEIAKIYDAENNYNKAEEYYSKAIDLTDEVSRYLTGNNDVQISYFAEKNEIFKSFTEFYIHHNAFRQAFNILDRARSRNVLNYLNNLVVQSLIKDNKTFDRLIEQDWLLHSGLFSGNTDSLMKSNDSLKISLIKNEPRLYQYLIYQKPADVTSLQEELSQGEYFFSFYIAKEYTITFKVSRNSFNYYKISAGKDDIVKKLRAISSYFSTEKNSEAYINPDLFSFDAQAAFNFYNEFLGTAMAQIPDGCRIIISPPAELAILPFELLVTDININQGRFNYDSQKYLLYKYDISYAPSSAAYINLKEKKYSRRGDILLVGDPQVNKSSFSVRRGLSEGQKSLSAISLSELKYSDEEIKQINKIISADKVLTSGNATETAFKINAPNSRIIHLSTHSFLLNNQPFIYFSTENDNTDDGFLEPGEIVQLKLSADIVVLSSCSSGLGTIDEAEGIIGLTKAFYEAGAKAVVYSLWDVNDQYTSKLMTLFYQYLSKGFDKSDALKKAKSDFIIKYSPNPYYWAAFVLSGNTSKITFNKKEVFSGYFILALSIGLSLAIVLTLFKLKKKNINFR